MEYDQTRLYTPGDDVRNLDWRVTARTGRAYTKLFREERERLVWICVDYRRSMFFATRGGYKAVVASECAAILAWGAVSGGDRVGGMIFDERSCIDWKPARGRAAALRLMDRMCRHRAWRDPAAAGSADAVDIAMFSLARVIRPGSLLFLIGDFRGFDRRILNLIAEIGRHSEVVLALIYDPLERDLPKSGSYRLADGRRERMIDAWDANVRNAHAERFVRRKQGLKDLAANPSIHFLECGTQELPELAMPALLSGR